MSNHIPTINEIERFHHKYAPNDKVYNLVYGHCQIVSEISLWCADNIAHETKIDKKLLQAACLLHDVGSYAFFDNDGNNLNDRLYPQHAILGAKILEDEGVDNRITSIVATHVLLGLTKKEIIETPWYLPERGYEPNSVEGQLLCYADRFHSKTPTFNAFDTFHDRLRQNLPLQAAKFEEWSNRFGMPDIPALAKKYKQPIK